MVKGVFWTYCGQFRHWTTGANYRNTATHTRRVVPLENPRGANHPASPTEAPDPPAGVLAQYLSTNNTDWCINPKASMAADLGGDLYIGCESVYDGVSLSLMGHLFIGSAVNYESKPPTLDDVDVGASYL